MIGPARVPFSRWPIVYVALILLYATTIRVLFNWTEPRGLHIDEASNAWNSWCLLHTGVDQWGARWPIVAERAFDDYRSTIYVYLALPFEWIGGLDPRLVRLPAALCGALTAGGVYLLAKRLFNARVGVFAALSAAVLPLQFCTGLQGHEAAPTPLIFAAVVLLNAIAGWPLTDKRRPLRFGWIALAGGSTGAAMYGFASLRLLIPATIMAIGVIQIVPMRGGRKSQSSEDLPTRKLFFARREFAGALLWTVAFLLVAGPLLSRHLTDPQMNRRLVEQRAGEGQIHSWQTTARRYIEPFEPTFFLHQLNSNPTLAAPDGYGAIQLFFLPPLLIGLAITCWRATSSRSARTTVVLLLVAPLVNALFNPGDEPNPYYFNAATVPLSLLTGIGCVVGYRWLKLLHRQVAVGVSVIYLAWFAIAHAQFIHDAWIWKDSYAQRVIRYDDVAGACDQIRPSLPQADAVYFTTNGLILPYILVLTGLPYDPAAWATDAKLYAAPPWPIVQKRTYWDFGKFYFIYDPAKTTKQIDALPSGSRIIMVLRPSEAALAGEHPPSGAVLLNGVPRLMIYRFVR